MGKHALSCVPGSRDRSTYGTLWLGVAFVAASLCVVPTLRAQTTVTWDTTSSGNWSDTGDWNPSVDPNNGGGNTYDVFLPDVDLPGTGTREVTLDQTGVTVNSLEIQEFPWPWPPEPTTPFDPFYNILKLDNNLNVTTNITLDGSRATLDLNGQTATAGTIFLDAPVFGYGVYWYRNAIDGDTGTNDGTSVALSPTVATDDGLPAATVLGGSYEGGYTVPTPSYVQPSTSVATGAFTDPVPLTGSATTGTIAANLDSQGLVWLNGSPTITGTVTNHSQWGYFRYDGTSGQNITFQNTITNSDPGAVMDLNGAANEDAAVTNENGAYMYNRGAVNLTSNMVNQSGGQYLFDPGASGTFFITGNLTNEGTGTIYSPKTSLLTSGVSSYMDFVGDFTMGHDTPGVNVVNEGGAVMVMQGNVLIGQVDQLPKGTLPDIISSLENYTGGTYTYDPTGSQHMEITGQIINDGTSTPGGYITTMNLLGDTIVRGRSLSSPILTNVNGAVLNYNAYIDVGYDTPNGQVVNQPQGNLDNNNGIINGYGDGNLLFRGGDQQNGDNSHPTSFINLYDTAQFTTGPQGSNTFDNYGYVNGNSGTPTFNSGIFNNYGTLTANNGSTFTMTSATPGSAAAVNNYGTTIVNTGGTLDTVGGFVNYSTFTFNTGGALEGPFIYNDLNGIINATGGTVSSTALANNVGGTMNLGTGATGALVVESSNVTQAGEVNIAANFNLVVANVDLNNSGTINLNGPNANVTAEGHDIINSGQITGGGTLGLASGSYDETNQVINSSSTASISVTSAGMTIGGTEAPINNGTISIASGGSGLAIVGGNDGDDFLTTGTITIGDGGGGATLTDLGTGLVLKNQGTVSGKGIIAFGGGIDNEGTITAEGSLALHNDVTNEDQTGTINIQNGALVLIPDMADFENAGTINFQAGNGTLSDNAAGNEFTNGATGQVVVSGIGNALVWGNGVSNEGTIALNSGSALSYPNAGLSNSNFISLNAATLTGTGQVDNSDNGTIIATGASTIRTGVFDNTNGGTLTMTGPGGNLTTGDFDNNGGNVGLTSTTASTGDFDDTDGTVSLTSTTMTTEDFTNTGGSLTIGGSTSVLNTDDFVNDGGLLSLAKGKVNISGTLSNGTSGGADGLIEVANKGVLTTSGDVTSSGSVILSGGSTFATNLGGPYGDFTIDAGSGSVLATGASLWDVGDVIQDDGTVSIASGSAGDSFDYTNNGGTLTLNSASTIANRPTFKVRGDLDNSGAVNLLGGATLNLVTTGNLTNSGNVTESGASVVTAVGTVDNTGGITMSGGTTFTSNGEVTNSGSLTLSGTNSTFATNGATAYSDFNNNSGVVSVGGAALFDVGTMTQDGGTVTIGGGAAGDTFAYSNTGGAIVLNNDSTLAGRPTLRTRGNFTNTTGTLTLLNGATMTTDDSFINNGSSAVTALSGASSVTANDLTNTGTLDVEGGSTFNSNAGPDSNAGGTLDIGGAGSTVLVNSLDNTGGQITVESGGEMDNDGVLTNNNAGATIGQILLDSGGILNTDNNVVSEGNITIQGGSTMTANDNAKLFSNNAGLVVVQNAGSQLRTFNLTNAVGATMKANGGGTIILAAGGALTNLGTLVADPGGVIQTAGAGDNNSGTILVSGTGSAFNTGATPTTWGALNNGFGASFSITSGGTSSMASMNNMGSVTVSGANSLLYIDLPANSGQNGQLGNNGGNVDISAGGKVEVGSYNGYGNVTADSGGSFLSAGIGPTDDTVDGVITALNTGSVTFGESLVNEGGGTLNVTGGGIGAPNTVMTIMGELKNSATINVSGGNAVLNLNGMATTGGAVTVQGLPGAISKVNSNGQWTIGGTANLYVGRFGNVDPPSITTAGTVTVEPQGVLTADTYIQTGGGTQVDGTLGGTISNQGGTIDGGGFIVGTLDASGGTIKPGGIDLGSDVLTISDAYSQEADATLNIGIAGVGNSDSLLVSDGDATLNGGDLYLSLSPTYVPQIGDTFVVIDAPDAVDLNEGFNVQQSEYYSDGHFEAGYTPTTAYVEFVVSVPEPASFGAMAGISMLLAMRRRRRAA
jgi:fibronectin-binding autotransporter adhesin